MTERVVLCMKWGTLYSAEYVNVLFSACKKYITGPFRFVCLTEDVVGLNPAIEVFPIPEIGLEHRHWYDGAWPKLGVFLGDLYGLRGRCLFIDLDTVLLANIDDFFTQPGPLVAINARPWRHKDGEPSTMSSIFAFDLGAMPEVVSTLQANRDALIAKYKIEQDYLHGEVAGIQYWPQPWLVSFKYHLRQPLLLDRFLPPKRPGPEAKALVFHGKPRPIALVRPEPGNWDRFPHYGSGAVDWMRQYWAEHGGQV